ncbi:MAG: DUF59 domain-containing protein [Bacteroidetes bacterium]|nr:DUF59 domain-containing protein [Bacteroidota bacterium]
MALDRDKIQEQIIEQIQTVYDPEIPVDIWQLGLIYEVTVKEDGIVFIRMTLTSPACPVAESLPLEVQEKAMSVEGVKDVDLRLVWDPPWNKEMMSEEARFALDMF